MLIVKSALSGLSWTASATLIKGGLQLAQLIILARVLTPIELGLLAIINLVVGFAQIFGDAGISNALIFHKDLEKRQLNQLYVINVLLGVCVSLFVVLLAYPIELFFAMDGLSFLLMMLSPIFLIRSLAQQQMALLQQQMQFNQIAKVEVLAAVSSFILLVVLLEFDVRLEAVIWSQLAGACMISAMLFCLYAQLRPSYTRLNMHEIIEPVRYGLYQSGESLINFLSAQFDQLLIGKILGAEVLGVYAYIKALVFRPALQLINPIVNKVAFPLMVNFKSSHDLKDIYCNIIALLSLINVPLYLTIAYFPEPVLLFAFGEDWVKQAELLRWLALYMLIISVMNPIGVLLRSTGEVKRGFWWNMFVTVVRPIAIFASISFGIVTLVQVLVVTQVLFFCLHYIVLIRPIISLSFIRFISVVMPPVITYTIALFLTLLLGEYFNLLDTVWVLMVIAFFYCVASSPILFRIFKFIRKSY
ncbi:polysaccharide transporter, PST family [Pseudoalteromonas ulvae UL12]|uniref:MOP flippase family protein n=1 Tax=Pseudoalteromonas ulvae TaxID=107327 RepID=UPI00186B5FB2|nr:MOP flippase family protein [Pseudoalteromonas ulvae]MBE0365087.1 polysaccharide transporter, PST family [Pseudoalteromonas ulvae UL12]